MRVSQEVQVAIERGSPVVALESTVLAHGLPWPRNAEVGELLEARARQRGAVPATVAVLAGEPSLGLDAAERERIARGAGVLKLSTRDLPVALAARADGATTVAATMWLASSAGIEVFATGGIGGVHRGPLIDVSADLTELGRTPMIVVCAGAKAILDLPATREALETAGVLVAGWQTEELPAFYSRRSGLGVDVRVDSADEVAALWRAHRSLALPGALLLCVPPPAEAELPADEIASAISEATAQAERDGVTGKELTPVLLRGVADRTGGRSLETNVALLANNVGVAADVARELAIR
jgi:pseudouridylate synthase